ncbi:uncharacterized protein LOC115783366 [Archocentrus centrarchus]|uniref:uncharacterized protein LOC115783366 n=1 Tax=Archocentrus centrarchus TaxID=63155 RepID=UPI0011E9C037|nr:uncharacterized protein LOC115783366 [Archocentrus centrarchus]
MTILHVLILCFLSDAARFARAGIWVGPEGGNLSLYNHFTRSGSTKFFCKKKCERTEDILLKTDGTTAQSGRYSIEYKEGSSGSSGRGRLSFTITHMTASDSGMYRFGLGNSSAPDSYSNFNVRVSNDFHKNSKFIRAETEGEQIQFPCANAKHGTRKFLCKNPCNNEGNVLIDTTNEKAENGRYSIEYTAGSAFGLYAAITQLTEADNGQYRCGYGNPLTPDSYMTQDIVVIGASKSAASTAQPTTQSQSFTSTISTPSSVYPQSGSRSWDRASHPPSSTPQTTTQSQSFTPGFTSSDCPDFFFPLVVCASLAGVLLLSVFLLLLYICKTKRNTVLNIRENDYTNMKFSAIRDD